jgi:uncharacterized protein involved in exopolysaccharide biosynthesis
MNKEMGLLDLIYIIAKRKYLVVAITFVFAVAAIVYALVTPKYWISSTVINPVAESGSMGSFSSDLMGMFAGGLVKTQKSEMAIQFISTMQSRTFRDQIVDEFDLISYFELQNIPEDIAREEAIRRLSSKIAKLRYDQESGLVYIVIETKDKEFSKKIAEYYLEQLQDYLRYSRMSKSRLQREFLEGRVQSLNREIDSLAVAIRDFQIEHNAIALDQQTMSLINLYSESIAGYFKADIEYELAKNQYSSTSPVVQDLEAKKNILADRIKELRLNAEIQKKVFEYIYPQYEVSKLDELRDMPSFEIIDKPVLAGLRSRPKRGMIVVSITIAAFLLGCIIALFQENVLLGHREQVQKIIQALKFGKPKTDL